MPPGSQATTKRLLEWVVCHSDGIDFYATEAEARTKADEELARVKANSCEEGVFDGWDEGEAESILVMRVTARAEKVDPNAPYQNVQYAMQPPDPGPDKEIMQIESTDRTFLSKLISWLASYPVASGSTILRIMSSGFVMRGMQDQAPQLPSVHQLREKMSALRDLQADPRAIAQTKLQPVLAMTQRVGRNDLCPCGSGMKFKRCCNKEKGPR